MVKCVVTATNELRTYSRHFDTLICTGQALSMSLPMPFFGQDTPRGHMHFHFDIWQNDTIHLHTYRSSSFRVFQWTHMTNNRPAIVFHDTPVACLPHMDSGMAQRMRDLGLHTVRDLHQCTTSTPDLYQIVCEEHAAMHKRLHDLLQSSGVADPAPVMLDMLSFMRFRDGSKAYTGIRPVQYLSMLRKLCEAVMEMNCVIVCIDVFSKDDAWRDINLSMIRAPAFLIDWLNARKMNIPVCSRAVCLQQERFPVPTLEKEVRAISSEPSAKRQRGHD